MAALIEAGANVDTCNNNGASPFFFAARNGHIDPVRELLRANASPLLSTVVETREHFVPLNVASYNDHSEVVRALIQQRGIIACAGESGGVDALTVVAAQKGHAEIVGMLVDAGVVDTGKALIAAARWGGGVVVTFLLQQRKLAGSPPGLAGYVNFCDDVGSTPLFGSIVDAYPDYEGVPGQVSPRVVRLLLDAGADTSTSVHVTDTSGGAVLFSGTSLAFTTGCLLREKKRRCKKKATKRHVYRLEAARCLLLRVEAVRAVSWLWVKKPLLVSCVTGGASGTAGNTTSKAPQQLTKMLRVLKRRGRGALLVSLFR